MYEKNILYKFTLVIKINNYRKLKRIFAIKTFFS